MIKVKTNEGYRWYKKTSCDYLWNGVTLLAVTKAGRIIGGVPRKYWIDIFTTSNSMKSAVFLDHLSTGPAFMTVEENTENKFFMMEEM